MGTYRVADYIMEFIADLGVKHVFLLPGGGAMFLNDALALCERLTPVPCQHEQACAIAAEAYSRIDGNYGVAMVTTGPGATNAITGVAGAWIESVPMLVISGQVKRKDLLGTSPLRQKGVQEVDIVSLIGNITKYAKTIERPEDIRLELDRAVRLSRSGRCGPVWLDVPLDIQAAVIDKSKLKGEESMVTLSPEIAPLFSDKLRELLRNSQRPLILAGHGVRLSGGMEELKRAAEKLQIPVATTWNALDLLPHNHLLNVGRPGVVALRGPNFAVQNCDLLISIGCRLDNIITAFNPQGFARGAKKVIVDVDPNEIDKLPMLIDLRIVSSAKTFLTELSKIEYAGHSTWIDRCQSWKLRYGAEHQIQYSADGRISHSELVDSLSRIIPESTLISTGSSGLAIEFFYTLFKNKVGQRVFLTSGLGSMGYGLPAAIGSCFSNGLKRMVAIESDGSLQLNIQELATLRAFKLPIILIIMNNDGYASIRNTQRNYFSSRFIGTGPEANLWMPELRDVSKAYDIPYCLIDSPKNLDAKLVEALGSQGPLIVDVRLERNETLAPKVSAIPLPDGSMTSMPLEDMSPLLTLDELEAEMIVPLLPESRAARKRE